MCFASSPKAQPAPPALPPPPVRADESNRAAVDAAAMDIRRRRGRESTLLTGGLGDTSYGGSTSSSQVGGKTMLGQ